MHLHAVTNCANSEQLTTFAERIDNDVAAASLSPEKRSLKYHHPAWSVELLSAGAKIVV